MPIVIPSDHQFFKPEDFKISEPPPPLLYKYMSADRIGNVLEDRMVKFTHLIDTNDSFEVRKTFKRFAGPKLTAMMKSAVIAAMTPEAIDQELQARLADMGVHAPMWQVKALLQLQFGMPIEEYIRTNMVEFVDMFASSFDSYKSPEEFLTEIGSTLLCFSLSERCDAPTMWAHYGDNHRGLVVVFDTTNQWFMNDSSPAESKLQKIVYLDEQQDEIMDDLQAAFSSKGEDWAYEREWRLNCSMKQIEKTIELAREKIHLRSFPSEAVTGVIVGHRTPDSTIEQVRDALKRKYPHASLKRATPRSMSGTYSIDLI